MNQLPEPTIQPWMRGPLELIRHAHGHFEKDGDTDRRIALIGFDNAIEVCIDVYIRLHPKLRKGKELKREEVDAASKNYHTKLEFLDKHLSGGTAGPAVPLETILWYHQLRNELYHSGNGMVPERHVVEGAFEAALAVFSALFGTDPSPLVKGDRPSNPPRATIPISSQHSEQMEFLRAFIEFEQTLVALVGPIQPSANRAGPSVPEMWRAAAGSDDALRDDSDRVMEIIRIRNQLVHGHGDGISLDRLVEAFVFLSDLTAMLKSKSRGRDTGA
jgi:hypothetical protein